MDFLELGTRLTGLSDRIRTVAEDALDSFVANVREQLDDALQLPDATVRTPIYKVEVDGIDITDGLKDRLISLAITDNPGLEADMLDLALDDSDGALSLPPKGAEVRAWIGYEDSGLVDKGSFTVDEIGHAGTPDVLTVRARSVDMRGGLVTQKERSWHGKTVGDIVAHIAAEMGLAPAVAGMLAGKLIEHIDQTNESASNFLQRLAGMFDAIATVKSGRLLFIPAGAGLTAAGKPIPSITITRKSGDRHQFNNADRDSYTAVKATWNDTENGTKGEVIWGKAEDDAERNKPPAPAPETTGNFRRLDQVQKTRSKAVRLAKKTWLGMTPAQRGQYVGVIVPYSDRTLDVKGDAAYGKADEAKTRERAQRRAGRDADRLATPAPVVAISMDGAENMKTLRHVYANKTNAIRGARAEWRRLQRGMATFTIELAEGIPELYTQTPAEVRGWKPNIDGTDWIVRRAIHNLTASSGLTTNVELEMRATELPG